MSFPAPLPDLTPLHRAALALSQLAEALRDLADQPAPAPQPAPDLTRMLSPAAVAAMTGDSPRAISEWCQQGRIRAEKHGRRWRIPSAEVEKFRARARARVGAACARRTA